MTLSARVWWTFRVNAFVLCHDILPVYWVALFYGESVIITADSFTNVKYSKLAFMVN